ncbi:MAG: sulfatase [Planctomycetota bacterium]
MKRRAFLIGLSTAIAGQLFAGRVGRSETAPRAVTPNTSGMNVLFVTIEDLTAGAVGCYGNLAVKTPHLDRFAGGATRFARSYCQAPMCNPSRSSFLTGLRPGTTGIYRNSDAMHRLLPEGTRSLPELLHQYAIYTVNIGKLFHHSWTAEQQLNAFDRLEYCGLPGAYQGVSRGLPPDIRAMLAACEAPPFKYSCDPAVEEHMAQLRARRDDVWRQAERGSAEYNAARAMFQQPMANILGNSGLSELQEHDGQKARLAAHLFGQLAKEKNPFFMSLGFSKPHTPLRCPKSYLDLYDLNDITGPSAAPEQDANIPAVAKRFGHNYDIFNSSFEGPVSDEAARQAIRAYYACVSFVDAQIGIVLAALDSAGLRDDTIVMIFSDHGFHLGEHGLWSKYTLFEQSTRVPLLVRVPGVTKGASCDEIVELVDLLPTLCDLLVIPPPENLEGTSFVPLLADPRQPWKLAAFTDCAIADHIGRSVRTKRWRYTDWQSRQTSLRQFELYDLASDPWEQNNLALDASHRNQRTILANLLQRGWPVAHQRSPAESTEQAGFPAHAGRHILW